MSHPVLLRVSGLTKAFPGVLALDGVSLDVHAGEILAVVGQNGSGKSTLVKVLAGIYEADAGTIEVRGDGGQVCTGRAATQELHFIHQDLGLVPSLSTIENLDLGRDRGRRALWPNRTRAEHLHATQLIGRFGARFDVRIPVGALAAAEQTIVAIGRALDGWRQPANVLVLDEPTAALPREEVERLMGAVRRVALAGAGVIFISHRLDEVLEFADRVVALRDGQVIANVPAGEFDHDSLVRMIAGRELQAASHHRQTGPGEAVLDAFSVAGGAVADLSLTLRQAEVVGVAGLLGSGQEHVCSLLFGARKRAAGEVLVCGRKLRNGEPGEAIANGVGYVPADRRKEALVMDHPMRENLTLPNLAPLRRRDGSVNARAERAEAARWAKRVSLRPPSPERPMRLFSGGNQQKVVLAKWLRNEPAVLLLDEPTQGVDVGAKESIYQLIRASAQSGAAVLVSSADAAELVALCDRVLVMRNGHIAAELAGDSLTEEQLVRVSLGLAEQAAAPTTTTRKG